MPYVGHADALCWRIIPMLRGGCSSAAGRLLLLLLLHHLAAGTVLHWVVAATFSGWPWLLAAGDSHTRLLDAMLCVVNRI
jgi:hypothetical protein